jgi:hypothetical protein
MNVAIVAAIVAAVVSSVLTVSLPPLARAFAGKMEPHRRIRRAKRRRVAEAKRYRSPQAVEERRLQAKHYADGKAFGENVAPWYARKLVAEREAKEREANE